MAGEEIKTGIQHRDLLDQMSMEGRVVDPRYLTVRGYLPLKTYQDIEAGTIDVTRLFEAQEEYDFTDLINNYMYKSNQ